MYEARQNKEKVTRYIQIEKKQPMLLKRNQSVLQKQRNIQDRQGLIDRLTRFIGELKKNHEKMSENADKKEIGEHDTLMDSSTNHHKTRTVTIKDLINDCQHRIDDYTGFNDRDRTQIKEGKLKKDKVTQL